MAKRTKKLTKKSSLKLEALESRQLLAGVTGGGTEVGSDIHHPNGNVYDQVLMNGSSVAVTADAGQVTRVSFLDLQGDIVQAEFSGAGTLTISLANFSADVTPEKYVQDVKYVQGHATFTITGSDASTNFSVFSVGKATAFDPTGKFDPTKPISETNNPADSGSTLFDADHSGGNHTADIQRVTIVADTSNPNGSVFGGIRAANAIFTGTSGVVGITAAGVQVQDVVRIGDIDANDSATPALTFGVNSQFGSVEVAGGDLVQSNGKAINNSNSYGYQISAIANVDAGGEAHDAQNVNAVFTNPVTEPNRTINLTTAIDNLTGTSGNDTFNGSHTNDTPVVSALDKIDGGAGNDVLNISDSDGGTAQLSGLSVKNVEGFVYTSTGKLGFDSKADVSGWTGLTSATVVLQNIGDNVGQSITASKDTAINITSSASGIADASTSGKWTIKGGSTVKLTQSTTSTAANYGTGGVDVTGVEGTTSVDITQSGEKGTGKLGAVTITDWATGNDNKGKTGTITTVKLNGLDSGTNSKISSNALTDLSLTKVNTIIEIDDQLAAHKDAGTTLAVAVNNSGGATLKDLNGTLKQVDITANGDKSTVTLDANSKNALNAVTVAGDKALTLVVSNSGDKYTSLTSTNTAGLTATVDEKVAVTTGDGADKITISAATKKAISLGAGNDWVSVTLDADGKLGSGGSVDGGEGTDTLSLNVDKAAKAAADSTLTGKVTGFEKLELAGAAAADVDVNLHNLGDINQIVISGDNATANHTVTLSKVSSGASIELTNAQKTTTVDVPTAAISNETLNVKLTTTTADLDFGDLDSKLVTTVNLSGSDTDDAAVNTATIDFTSTSLKTLNITGNSKITVNSKNATTIDASGLSKALNLTTGSIGADATIKGSSDVNTVDASAADHAVTITTGGKADTITVGTKNSTIDAGAGANVITVGGGTNTITSGNDGSTVTLNGGTNTVTLGSGNDTVNIGAVGASTINVGSGTDTVVFKAGAVTGQTGGYYVTLSGMGKGDKIDLHNIDNDAADDAGGDATSFNSTELTLGQGVAFSDYLNQAANGDHSGNSLVRWFRYGGDTFIVIDNGAANTFTAGTDMVIKLTGSINLAGGTAAALTTDGTAVLTI